MAETRKILAQTIPAANASSASDAYTVPASTQTIVSSIIAANIGANTSFRIRIAPAGAADTANQTIYPDLPLQSNDSYLATLGITLGATDKVRVGSVSGNVVFTIFGVEIV